MSKKQDITKLQVFISLFLLSLIILLAPHIIRAFKQGPMLIGEEPYYHARISRQITEEGIPGDDSYIYGGRQYAFNPYHCILASIAMPAGVIPASKAIPFACGMISVLIFYFILKNIGFDKLNRIMITIVFLFSPVFIYTFSLSTPFCAVILLDLLGFYLFMQKEKKLFALSIVTLVAASFFSASNLIIILILALSYTWTFDKKKNRFKTIAFLIGAVFFFYYVPLYFKLGFLSSFRITREGLLQRFVTDLGGFLGFSIFALLLSILGFVIAWGNKKRFYKIYLIMIAVILYSFFYNYAVIYSNFIISILSGIALSSLIKRKWSINIIRNLSILLLFCSLLFSAVSYTMRISDQQPSAELIEALDWIKYNSDEGEVVFSHPTNGFWIEFEAERPVVLDSLADDSLEHKTRLEDSSKIFSSWDIEQTRSLLTKYNVSLIVITSDMSEGIVWDKPEQGLAYLVRNSETFKKEYNNDYVGVWRYIYDKNG